MDATEIRSFQPSDAVAVRDLFIKVNRRLAPPDMQQAFEDYIARSLAEEIDCIAAYYSARGGSFWVAEQAGRLVGMFGLEAASPTAMELRRMYVDPDVRRRGLGRALLQFAEDECRRRQCVRLELSTSALQTEALALYRSAGYQLMHEEIADAASNKTLGGGLRRYHFAKVLLARNPR